LSCPCKRVFVEQRERLTNTALPALFLCGGTNIMIYTAIFCNFATQNINEVDIWSKEKRSECMSKIRSKDTKPELALRKALFARGFRYRVNDTKLPGKPDIVLPKYKTVIFLHGCFWHRHEGCKYAYTPKTNTKFWVDKITSNVERDKINLQKLTVLGWNVLTVWECEIRHTYKHDISPLIDRIEVALTAQIFPKMTVKFYEQRENEILMVAEDIVEYQRTPKQ
jgi:DNA mismatch endonuclease (patch repair protein)